MERWGKGLIMYFHIDNNWLHEDASLWKGEVEDSAGQCVRAVYVINGRLNKCGFGQGDNHVL